MWIIYDGHADIMVDEFNGVKYLFSKKNPMVELPMEAYTFFAEAGSPCLPYIKPCNPPLEVMVNILINNGYTVISPDASSCAMLDPEPNEFELEESKPIKRRGRPKRKKE